MHSRIFSKYLLFLNEKSIVGRYVAATGKFYLSKFSGNKGQMGEVAENIKLNVEKDAKKLVTHVCGTNLLAEGGEDIKVKPDSEYPDWLWSIHIGAPLPLEKLDPNTKHYWNRVQNIGKKEHDRLIKLRKHRTVQK